MLRLFSWAVTAASKGHMRAAVGTMWVVSGDIQSVTVAMWDAMGAAHAATASA